MTKKSERNASNSIYLQNFEHKKKLNGAVDKLALEKLRTFSEGDTEIERRENALIWSKNLKTQSRHSMIQKVELRRDKSIDRDLVYELTEAENLKLLKEVDWVYHGNFYPSQVAQKHPETAFSITTYVVSDYDDDYLDDENDDLLLDDLDDEDDNTHLMYMASYGYNGGSGKGGYSSYIYAATLDEAIDFITSEFKSTGWNSAFDRVVSYNLKRQEEKYARKHPKRKNRGSNSMPEEVYLSTLSKIQKQTSLKLQKEAWNNPNINRVVNSINKAADTATLYDTCDRFLIELAKKWLREARERDREEKKARRLSDDNIIDLDEETAVEDTFPVAISPSLDSTLDIDDEKESELFNTVGNISSNEALTVGGGVGRSRATRDIEEDEEDNSKLLTDISQQEDDISIENNVIHPENEYESEEPDTSDTSDTSDTLDGSDDFEVELENIPQNSEQIRAEAMKLIDLPNFEGSNSGKRTSAPIISNDSGSNAEETNEQERLEQERLEQERLEQERLEQERLEQERLEQERLEQERLEQERLEQERLEQERLEQERIQREQEEAIREERRLRKEAERKTEIERKIRKNLEHKSRIIDEKKFLNQYFTSLKNKEEEIENIEFNLASNIEYLSEICFDNEVEKRKRKEEEEKKRKIERSNRFKAISNVFKDDYSLLVTSSLINSINESAKNSLSQKELDSYNSLVNKKIERENSLKKKKYFIEKINSEKIKETDRNISNLLSNSNNEVLRKHFSNDYLIERYSNTFKKFENNKLILSSEKGLESTQDSILGILEEVGVNDRSVGESYIEKNLPELFDITRFPIKLKTAQDINDMIDSII